MEGIDEEMLFLAGSTTVIVGAIVPVAQPAGIANVKNRCKNKGFEYLFVCVSVGDCKAFHVGKNGRYTEITVGNRRNISDACDPGGRLGSYKEDGSPDLRNISCYWHPCNKEETIVLMTDGVYDNLGNKKMYRGELKIDPRSLGKLPKDFQVRVSSWDKMEELKGSKEYVQTETRMSDFAQNMCENVVNGENEPEKIVEKLLQYCVDTTKSSREWSEANPNSKLPKDYVQFPGKMDHATVIACKINFQ